MHIWQWKIQVWLVTKWLEHHMCPKMTICDSYFLSSALKHWMKALLQRTTLLPRVPIPCLYLGLKVKDLKVQENINQYYLNLQSSKKSKSTSIILFQQREKTKALKNPMQNAERIPFSALLLFLFFLSKRKEVSCNGIWTKEIMCSKYRPLTKKLKIILKCKTVFQLSIRQKQNRKSRLFLVPKVSSTQFLELSWQGCSWNQ